MSIEEERDQRKYWALDREPRLWAGGYVTVGGQTASISGINDDGLLYGSIWDAASGYPLPRRWEKNGMVIHGLRTDDLIPRSSEKGFPPLDSRPAPVSAFTASYENLYEIARVGSGWKDGPVWKALIDAGWTPPPPPAEPKKYRVRVVKWKGGGCTGYSAAGPDQFGDQNRSAAVASTIVELTEGVFDDEWASQEKPVSNT